MRWTLTWGASVEKTIRLVTFAVAPAAESGELFEFGGAIVNAWVADQSDPEALKLATCEIERSGWYVKETISIETVQRQDYESDPSGLAYFEQALLDDLVLVFHTWPVSEGPVQ
jgi:hypothetical protein